MKRDKRESESEEREKKEEECCSFSPPIPPAKHGQIKNTILAPQNTKEKFKFFLIRGTIIFQFLTTHPLPLSKESHQVKRRENQCVNGSQ